MKRRKKHAIAVWVLIVAAIVIAAVIAVLITGSPNKSPQISREEFLLIYENEIRPQVLILSQDPGGDWQSEAYHGTTLGQYAVDQTVAALKHYKAQQQLFREYQICDFSFEGFVSQWQSQEKDGNPYGVQAYSQYDYYVYLHSIYRLQVIEQLKVAEEESLAFYESNLEQFTDADIWVLDIWQTSEKLHDGQNVLEKAMNGEDREEVSHTQVTIDEDGAKYYSELLVLLSDAMEQLKTPGQTVYRENDQVCLLARSKSYAAGQPKPYEACKDVVQNRCRQARFEQAVAQASENITVTEQALPAAGK